MDISSDLTELGKTPVTVVSAGAKSILDIPRTLEYLVTLLCAHYHHLKIGIRKCKISVSFFLFL